MFRTLDVLEDIEYPNEIELAVREGEAVASRQAEVDSAGRGTGNRQRGPAQVAAEYSEIRPFPFHSFRDRPAAAPNIQHLAVYVLQVGK
jgi:hypothetical protein